jgi:hypothetical protein
MITLRQRYRTQHNDLCRWRSFCEIAIEFAESIAQLGATRMKSKFREACYTQRAAQERHVHRSKGKAFDRDCNKDRPSWRHVVYQMMVRRTCHKNDSCPVARTLDAIGDGWSLLIVRDARDTENGERWPEGKFGKRNDDFRMPNRPQR